MVIIDEEAVDRSTENEERTPGEPDMWVFVVFESLVFTSYFCVYLYNRVQHSAAFLDAQSELNMALGVLDTILLLSSSWAIARCAYPARAGQFERAQRSAYLTAGLGVAFLALKLVEWVHLIGNGQTFTSSEYMQYFFFLTGMHAVHMLIGFVVLGILIRNIADARRRSLGTIETCTTYWHTVDLYWVIIFALLYVVR